MVAPFSLDDVRLMDGPFLAAQEANRRYLHLLDADSLLYNFRVNAGLPSPGSPYGGWERPDCEVRGHFVGHYLTACALMVASTGDEALEAKADGMVAALAECQAALGNGYLSAFPESFWDRLESLTTIPWAPYYTIHKIMAGLLDMYRLCGNEQALDVVKGMAAYFKNRTDRFPVGHWDRILGVEFGGMSEVLHDLYAVTGDPAHLELAHRFDHDVFLGPLALDHDNLSGLHANTNIPKIAGAARRYEVTGDERYRHVVEFFWERVTGTRSYATGGSNMGELWPEPNALAGTLNMQTQECCTTYNMLKVTRYLTTWTADPRYGDFYERCLFNGILGTQDPETGMLLYFVPLCTGATKRFGTPFDDFWCCYGTGIESFAKLGDSIYFHDEDTIYVEQFVASRVRWAAKGLELEQETAFPEQQGSALIIRTETPVRITVAVRIPAWCQSPTAVLNGQPLESAPEPGTHLRVTREWRDGDRIELDLPMSLRGEALLGDDEMVAVMYGPLVLAGLTPEPACVLTAPANLPKFVEPAEDEPLAFVLHARDGDIRLVPLFRVIGETYGVYWLVTPEDSPRYQALLAEEKAAAARARREVDYVEPISGDGEEAHRRKGENTQAGVHQGRHWRHAVHPGWFSWELAVLPDRPMSLLCTYWGDDAPPRTFDILIDGVVVATQSLSHDRPRQFFDVEYAIPMELTRGKDRVTVRFEPHEGNIAGGVFRCATLRPEE